MAIRIRESLRPKPENIRPGNQLKLLQALSSTRSSGERATITYSLDPGHDIWFENRTGERSKDIERVKDVPSKKTRYEHITRLVRADGEAVEADPGAQAALVQIDQVITWPRSRAPREDATVVGILS